MNELPAPNGFPDLPPDAVHVWLTELTVVPQELERCQAILTENESTGLATLQGGEDQSYRMISRAHLRRLLGVYLDCPPQDIPVREGKHGKPVIDPGFDRRLHFNVSHSGGLGLIALCRNHEVGIDIEQIDPERAWQDIAATVFSEKETAAIRRLPETRRMEAFFTVWSCKEACVKATGGGMLTADRGPEILMTADGPTTAPAMFLKTWQPLSGFTAALASPGQIRQVTHFHWMDFFE